MSEINDDLRPKVGVGVYIVNDKNELLLSLRSSVHASGFWCAPGGHMEYGETFLEAGARETKEEVDIDVVEVDVVGVISNVYPEENKHYVTVHMKAKEYSGEAKLMELDKFVDMKWFPLTALPENIFPATKSFLSEDPLCLCDSGKKYKKCCGK
ncbi:MAG: NUDIX domain-containing protein [Candidatus Falkowbacteria bacterium]